MAVAAWGAATDAVSFNRDVRPILSDRCFSCHGPDSAARKSALRLDQEESARAALQPGDPAKSPLFQRITSTDKARRMPPAYLGRERLPDAEIDILRRWIEQGARYQPHWSLIAPRTPGTPGGERGRLGAQSQSIASCWHASKREGLRHSPEADPSTLLRRVTLDLTGLPPTPAETEAFLTDTFTQCLRESGGPSAGLAALRRAHGDPLARSGPLCRYQRLPDRRPARYVALARLGDRRLQQRHAVRPVHHRADRRAICCPTPRSAKRSPPPSIATTAPVPRAASSTRSFAWKYVADRAETTATVWLGLTIGCARCHDHKYDPITQKEFYQFFAFFNNTPDRGFVYNFGNEPPFIHAPLPDAGAPLGGVRPYARRCPGAAGRDGTGN